MHMYIRCTSHPDKSSKGSALWLNVYMQYNSSYTYLQAMCNGVEPYLLVIVGEQVNSSINILAIFIWLFLNKRKQSNKIRHTTHVNVHVVVSSLSLFIRIVFLSINWDVVDTFYQYHIEHDFAELARTICHVAV